jgi:hypothetical protein
VNLLLLPQICIVKLELFLLSCEHSISSVMAYPNCIPFLKCPTRTKVGGWDTYTHARTHTHTHKWYMFHAWSNWILYIPTLKLIGWRGPMTVDAQKRPKLSLHRSCR